ncbi:MAG: type II methionyl aminopeptidase [Candidatus Nanohaloarchaea archaeon]
MDEGVKQRYIEAGEAIQAAREHAREVAEPGTSFVEIAESIEKVVRENGCEPAFPVNLSANEEAAHYTPPPDGDRVLSEDDVLKIDIGAHSDGYIADTALTVNPSGKHREVVDAVEEVLQEALDFIEPGVTVEEFGSFVQKQVPDEYQVVRNLTGHYLGRYTQHAGVSIPNVDNGSQHDFQQGDAVAIEPFITAGSGKVKDGAKGNIYRLERDGNVRGRQARKILGDIKEFQGLPFTTRWLDDFSGRDKMAMKRLVDSGIVHSYPVLKEVEDGLVAQAEHTVLVGADGGENVGGRRYGE